MLLKQSFLLSANHWLKHYRFAKKKTHKQKQNSVTVFTHSEKSTQKWKKTFNIEKFKNSLFTFENQCWYAI